jgi:hypothetical protein
MERPIRLDPSVWTVLERLAAEDDVSVGQIIRDAINRDIRRRAEAKTPVRADERLVAPLRVLLADDFAYAKGWGELQARLFKKGCRLAETGGGLILQSQESGARICKASELGYSYSALLRRFDSVFPGHAHTAPLRRIRGH